MPNIKASKKAVKVIAKKTDNNHELKASVKNYVRKCDLAIASGNKEEAKAAYSKVQKAVDTATDKGLMKKNTAAREKSRLESKIKEMK